MSLWSFFKKKPKQDSLLQDIEGLTKLFDATFETIKTDTKKKRAAAIFELASRISPEIIRSYANRPTSISSQDQAAFAWNYAEYLVSLFDREAEK